LLQVGEFGWNSAWQQKRSRGLGASFHEGKQRRFRSMQLSAPVADQLVKRVEVPIERIVYRERTAGSYARRFTLPAEVDQSQSAARLDNGVLTLTLGKRSAAASAQLTVN
jgi:hypothetical protein